MKVVFKQQGAVESHLHVAVFSVLNFGKEQTSLERACIELPNFAFAEPLCTLAIFPNAEALLVRLGGLHVLSKTMLLPFVPVAFVNFAISPGVDPVALFLIVQVLSLEPPAVSPSVKPNAVHHVLLPLALVDSVIVPPVDANAMDLVFKPLTSILRAILPFVHSKAELFAVSVLAFELGSVGPDFNSLAFLGIVDPLSLVDGSIQMLVSAFAISPVVVPVAFIAVAVDV